MIIQQRSRDIAIPNIFPQENGLSGKFISPFALQLAKN
jgi:hypothetical protein